MTSATPIDDAPHSSARTSRTADPAVEFTGVTKRYGTVTAVADVSFAIERGTLVTLLGPSGCGKTTTLRMIAGLELPSEGRILIDGEDVTLRSAAERDVSMVFQSYALFPHMSVMDNVCYGLRVGGARKADAEARAAATLAAVGLSGFERRLPSELSGGQQQRVAVARAIVLEPKVLLFDEPLSNLDAKMRRRVREDIRALQQDLGLTVVYVTHDQDEALAVSDRIIVMQARRIVQDGSPRDLYERPANRFVADFIGDATMLAATVRRLDETMAEARVGGAVVQLRHFGLATDGLELAVRPQGFRLRPGEPQPGEIAGTVTKCAYLGSHMEYEVRLDPLQREVFVIDADVAAPIAPGTAVGVSILSAAATLVPATREP